MKIKLNDNKKGIIALSALGIFFILNLCMMFFYKFDGANAFNCLKRTSRAEFVVIGLISLVLVVVCFISTALAAANYFIFKKNRFSRLKTGAIINFLCAGFFDVMCIIYFLAADNGKLGFLVFLIFDTLLYIIVHIMAAKPELNGKKQSPITAKQLQNNIVSSGQTTLSLILVSAAVIGLIINSITLLFVPLFSSTNVFKSPTVVSIINSLSSHKIPEQIIALGYVFLLFINFALLVNVILKFVINTVKFLRSAKILAIYNIFLTFVIMAYSLIKFVMAKFNGEYSSFTTYINVIIAFIIYIIFTIFAGRAERQTLLKHYPKQVKKVSNRPSLSPLLFLLAVTGATFSMLFVKLYSLDINAPTSAPISQKATGYDIIFKPNGGFQSIFSLLLIVVLVLSALFFILTVLNYITDAENYKQAALQYAQMNMFFQFFFFVIGLFFVLMVPSFDTLAKAIFGDIAAVLLGQDVSLSEYAVAKTSSFIPVIIGFALLVMMQFICYGRKAKEKAAKKADEKTDEKDKEPEKLTEPEKQADEPPKQPEPDKKESENIVYDDPCPAFSELDNNLPLYNLQLQNRQTSVFENLTLESLTDFIIEYAKNCPERLSYNKDNVSTFIAGLGASRLSILQGMSGTGKTSLPKVFMQAIYGNCEMVEVESSWRDKNELLGYYNEFSKKYTPKKFTQYLYKAKLNATVPTFIVLDELNLSRIEYYFSDFLSLMETRENLREIKLLDIQLFPPKKETPDNEDGQTKAAQTGGAYLGLTDGHTIKIPANVWFIGTANRDESTFEISDKVYDRAQTMNFDKRAPKILTLKEEVPPRFVEYGKLAQLFEEAKSAEFNAETNPLVISVEKLLEPYKISFGNRVLMQIEDFVKIYLKCNDISTPEKYERVLNNAIENILFSKVVRKLELKIIENKSHLIESFEALNFKRCAAFIKSLAEN